MLRPGVTPYLDYECMCVCHGIRHATLHRAAVLDGRGAQGSETTKGGMDWGDGFVEIARPHPRGIGGQEFRIDLPGVR